LARHAARRNRYTYTYDKRWRGRKVINKAWFARLDKLVEAVQGPEDWDVLIYGDGSGSTRPNPIGWGTVLICRHNGLIHVENGAHSNGTVYLAEMMPYLLALDWYKAVIAPELPSVSQKVVIVTDNLSLAQTGSKLATGKIHLDSIEHHTAIWAGLDYLSRDGLEISYYHARRETHAGNMLADVISKYSRFAIETVMSPRDEAGNVVDPYYCVAGIQRPVAARRKPKH